MFISSSIIKSILISVAIHILVPAILVLIIILLGMLSLYLGCTTGGEPFSFTYCKHQPKVVEKIFQIKDTVVVFIIINGVVLIFQTPWLLLISIAISSYIIYYLRLRQETHSKNKLKTT